MSGKRPVIQCLPVAPVPITRVLYSRAPRRHFTATTDITNEVITSLPISTALNIQCAWNGPATAWLFEGLVTILQLVRRWRGRPMFLVGQGR
jgi:hypothetical protein